ncbi:hypothetical protein FH972_010813 [Carpinus fangiana]|uniref:Uncharacterized protein n=1 Tax=Carpinus fangiana TaxID=176857 RepID=A0A660KSB8_9ROSI|nr:hypothetical protein FH972_010813 [Carpinus fangiana]
MGWTSSNKDEATEKHMGLSKMVQILLFLVVFVAGVVIGLATTKSPRRPIYIPGNSYAPWTEQKVESGSIFCQSPYGFNQRLVAHLSALVQLRKPHNAK